MSKEREVRALAAQQLQEEMTHLRTFYAISTTIGACMRHTTKVDGADPSKWSQLNVETMFTLQQAQAKIGEHIEANFSQAISPEYRVILATYEATEAELMQSESVVADAVEAVQ